MAEEYYIQMETPAEFRKNLLQASKSTLHSLSKYNTIRQIREEKEIKLQHLRNEMKELLFLTSKLNEALPHFSSMPEQLPNNPEPPEKHIDNKTSDIETELKRIEDKLSKL